MHRLFAVALGGSVGALLRYWISSLLPKKPFPLGTFCVNILGCLLFGALMVWVEERRAQTVASESIRLFLMTGILGSLTTFATFGWESFHVTRSEGFRFGFLNVAANLFLGLLFVWIGYRLTRLFV